jgi:hypothetical protein
VPIVNCGNAAYRTGLMIQNLLDHMRRDTQPRHTTRHRRMQILPFSHNGRDINSLVESAAAVSC